MPTNAELAAKLLRNAAEFFRSVGEQNAEISEQMQSNADTYDMVAGWVEQDAGAEGPPVDDVAGEAPAGPGPASEASTGEDGDGGESDQAGG
jgi:hypothetical protein